MPSPIRPFSPVTPSSLAAREREVTQPEASASTATDPDQYFVDLLEKVDSAKLVYGITGNPMVYPMTAASVGIRGWWNLLQVHPMTSHLYDGQVPGDEG